MGSVLVGFSSILGGPLTHFSNRIFTHMIQKICCSLFVLLLATTMAFGQATDEVKGTITTSDGETVIGATISVKGTTSGTVSDIDGTFSLRLEERPAILVFSYTGLQTQEVNVKNETELNIVLAENISLLDEVVVVGYGTQKRSSISGAVSTVTSDEITETPVLRTEQALQGRVAGVQVAQSSGSPGSPLTVRVRGVGTINNSDPLYIVDGIPVEGIDFLNPNDIESINVLKDAASSAIYGARGANGVVLITTKGGKKNQEGSISYHTYYGVQSAWKNMNLLNAREYAILSNEAHINSGRVPLPEFSNPEILGEGTDWQSAIFQDAPMVSHQLTLSGGGERSAYTVSGNYFEQDGIVGGEKSGFERYTVRLNTVNDLKDWLTVGNTLGFTYLERNFLPENNEFVTPLIRALNMDPVTPIRKPDGTYAYSYYSDTDITNPINAIEQIHDKWTSNRIVGSVFGELKLMEQLRFKSTFSVDATFATRDVFRPLYDLSINPTIGDAPAGERNLVNSVGKEHNTWRNMQWENVLNYKTTIQEQHALDVTVGTTFLDNRFDFSGGGNTNLPSNDPADAYISNTIDPIASQSAYAGATEASLLSFFGKVNYEWNDRYLASATFRADGSSRFGANNRFGYFPSFSLGWVINREDFWKWDDVSLLKLRASWGQNGNDRIGNYSFSTIVNAGQNYTFGQGEIITNGNVPLVAANPDLKWETSTQTDIGLDVELYDGQVYFVADYYVKKTSDMLYAAPIPLTAGTLPPVRNIGEMENTGLELSLNYRNREGVFKYGVGANIAFVSTEVISLGEGGEPITSGNVFSAGSVARTEVGHPIAAFYGYVTDGIFQNQAEVEAHAVQNENTAPGDIRFKDLDGDGIITSNDRTFIGNPTPDFTYGVTLDAEYKGFDLSLFLQGVSGNEIYNGIVRYDFSYTNRPQMVLNRWTGPGTTNTEPRVTLSDPNRNARVSDRFVEDGSYLRIKNLQIGYQLPRDILSKLRLNKLRVYVSSQNLWTLSGYSGLDPEIGSTQGALDLGIDRGFYPQARTFLGGIQITF